MSGKILAVALALAYGPLAIMLLLYGIGLALRLAGRPGFLSQLIKRTQIPQPPAREPVDGFM